jgi:HAD superfamily hydrolase (TIGR01459 family)
MTELIQNLSQIAPRYDAVFCDLWGCLHDGKHAFPEAVAALQTARRGGTKVILLTNAPRPRGSVVAQLDRMEVPRDAWDQVVTSGDATQYALFSGTFGTKAFFIGAEKDEPFFTDLPADLTPTAITRVEAEAADVLICTGLAHDLTETPGDYKLPLMRAKNAGLTMLCANPDIIVDYGTQRLYCAGALAAAYEAMGGKTRYFGKPHPPIYDFARRRLGELGAGRSPQIFSSPEASPPSSSARIPTIQTRTCWKNGWPPGRCPPPSPSPSCGNKVSHIARTQHSSCAAIALRRSIS